MLDAGAVHGAGHDAQRHQRKGPEERDLADLVAALERGQLDEKPPGAFALEGPVEEDVRHARGERDRQRGHREDDHGDVEPPERRSERRGQGDHVLRQEVRDEQQHQDQGQDDHVQDLDPVTPEDDEIDQDGAPRKRRQHLRNRAERTALERGPQRHEGQRVRDFFGAERE